LKITGILSDSANYLASISDSPRLDSELILAHVLECTRFDLYLESNISLKNDDMELFKFLLERRKKGEPVAYILGKKEFFEDSFFVDKRVLVPRPETELLVEYAINEMQRQKIKSPDILDICTGSGCIGISVFKFFDGTLTLSDISKDALGVALINAKNILGEKFSSVTAVESNLFSNISKTYDLITANPPYLSEKDMKEIQKPLTYEPENALFGGKNGFELTDKIIEEAPKHLNQGGLLIIEMGYEGASFLKEKNSGLEFVKILKDYQNIERHVVFIRK